jgi:hypothetical protein
MQRNEFMQSMTEEESMTEKEFVLSMRAVENFLADLAEDLTKSIAKAQDAHRPAGIVDFLIERRNNCLQAKAEVVKCREAATNL